MKFLSVTSIFARIYLGLVLLVIFAVIVAYLLFQGINQYRSEHYKEDIQTAMMYLFAEGISRQDNPIDREYWMKDAESILGFDLEVKPIEIFDFGRFEKSRLEEGKLVTSTTTDPLKYRLSYLLNDGENVVTTVLSRESIREKQITAMPLFILDDLAHHPEDEDARLAQLQQKLFFNISFAPFPNAKLDEDQMLRLRRNDTILVFNDQHRAATFSLLSLTHDRNRLLVVGPIERYNPLPSQLIFTISLITLLIISLGVYGLIVPLHQKVKSVQNAVSRVRSGDFDARANINGQDEIAMLGNNFNDMTEHIQRLIGAQRELTRAVSHELRTPVARIRFGIEMLVDTDEYEDRLSQQSDIDKDIETLNDLIDEILTYAKLEEGTPSLYFENVALYDLIEQITEETKKLGKPLTIEVLKTTDFPIYAMADYRYLHRVLQNLAGNATRYASSKVLISAGVIGNQAFISVEDDGQGIPEKDREKVFMPFARLDDSRTRASGGYGLGLSIVSKIVYWFKGTIAVDQSPTLGGARFIMRWPLKSSD